MITTGLPISLLITCRREPEKVEVVETEIALAVAASPRQRTGSVWQEKNAPPASPEGKADGGQARGHGDEKDSRQQADCSGLISELKFNEFSLLLWRGRS